MQLNIRKVFLMFCILSVFTNRLSMQTILNAVQPQKGGLEYYALRFSFRGPNSNILLSCWDFLLQKTTLMQ